MKKESCSTYSHKRWLSVVACCILGLGSVHAQSITWAIVNAAGFENGENGSLRWTIGEPLTLEVTGDAGSMRIGFMPFAFIEEEITLSRTLDPDIEVTLAPNPAAEEIRISVPGHENQMIHIFSLDGRSEISIEINHEVQLDIRSLPSGPYVLYVIDPTGAFNSTTFIKS